MIAELIASLRISRVDHRRHQSLTERAVLNTCAESMVACSSSIKRSEPPRSIASRLWIANFFLLAAATSCRPQAASSNSIQASAPSDPKASVRELVEALTPLTKTVTSDITDQKFIHGQELLAQLRKGGTPVGVEAMNVLGEKHAGETPWPVDVERGLLDVAAHAAPVETRPLLEALVTQYGATLELRTHALILYSETWPEETLKILEPLVTKARPNQTLPPAEFMVRAWVTASEKTGRSPVKVLADVATNLYQDETARIRAVKELGRYRDPLSTQALSAILVESTGDAYLRRMAAQGLRDTLDRESACKIFETVAQREADLGMLEFMRDMLDKNCSNAPEKKVGSNAPEKKPK